jgi:hypothetical protein
MFVISDKELERLSVPALSNGARAVYLLGLRPRARSGKAMLDQDTMRALWPDYQTDDTLQDYLFELLGQGLIERRKGAEGLFEDGETVFLPAADRSRRIFLSS